MFCVFFFNFYLFYIFFFNCNHEYKFQLLFSRHIDLAFISGRLFGNWTTARSHELFNGSEFDLSYVASAHVHGEIFSFFYFYKNNIFFFKIYDFFFLFLKKGQVHVYLSQWSDAKQCFLNAVSANPYHTEALCALGETHLALGEPRLAEKTLKDAAKIDPNSPKIW